MASIWRTKHTQSFVHSLVTQLFACFCSHSHRMMASKSFTIDHILHGPSSGNSSLTTSVGDNPTYPIHSQQLVPYWTDPTAYYPTSSWPIQNAAAIWFQQQQHAMPVDLSIGSQRPADQHHQSPTAAGSMGFNNVSGNWMATLPTATGCWPSAASPELSYSHHHGKKKKEHFVFYFSHENSHSILIERPLLSSWEFVFLSVLYCLNLFECKSEEKKISFFSLWGGWVGV